VLVNKEADRILYRHPSICLSLISLRLHNDTWTT